MVAYSFKQRFVPKIEDRTKKQTIRNLRTGRTQHAQPGDLVHCYFGMRTRQCRKIGVFRCTALSVVILDWPVGRIMVDPGNGPRFDVDPNTFARADGFENIDDMRAFWREEHGLDRYRGALIEWRDL